MDEEHSGWPAVTHRAEANHGIVAVDDLAHAGFSPRQVDEHVRRRLLVPVGRGSYRVAGSPPTFEARVMGAIVIHGPGTWASHRTAAGVWGLAGFPRDHRIELLRPVDGSNQRQGAKVHRSTLILPHHVTRTNGVPVTTPARTLFDLAATNGPERLERAVADAVRRRLCTDAALRVVTAEMGGRGRPGTRRMRQVLDGRGIVPTESELEDLGRAVILAAGLPEPEWQADVFDAEGWIGRVDGLYRAEQVILELDSQEWHGQRVDLLHDARRDRRAVAAGYLVVRARWSDLTQRPEAVVAQLRALLDARAA